jgi:hypothetical protein
MPTEIGQLCTVDRFCLDEATQRRTRCLLTLRRSTPLEEGPARRPKMASRR